MTGPDGTNGNEQPLKASVRRCGLVMGGAVGAFVAAAAMATGSAAPAKADFEDLLDPIIQPILTSLTDSLTNVDPTLAADLTAWTDTFLADLNTIDAAAATASSAAASGASPAEASQAADSSTSGTYDIPITLVENTEPTVNATIDGSSSEPLLVDTGSSGLVIPWEDLGSSESSVLEGLGFPTGIGIAGYGDTVQYLYLTYDTTVDYDGVLTTSGTPVDVEIFSWPTTLSSSTTLEDYFDELLDNGAFTSFLSGNDVNGILGIGDYDAGFLGIGASAGPTESPLEAAGFTGVTVDEPAKELIVSDSNPGTAIATLDGAPTPSGNLTETVTTSSGATVGSATVSDDVDSGGVYGTIPASLGEVPDGDTISVYDGSTLLYSYTVENDGGTQLANESPTVLSADDTASGVTDIDSGYEAFENEPIYIDYSNDTLSFDDPLS